MDLSKLTKKTLTVSRSLTYTYYASPSHPSKPSLFLCHGWPDSAHLWSDLINNYLLPKNYGIIALDCLGYGETSKPTDPQLYSWRDLTADAIEILDAEHLPSVIALGHDWGSTLCQHLYNLFLQPGNRPYPIDRLYMTKEFLLVMKIRGNIQAKQGEERRNGEWFIAVADELSVQRPLVEVNAQKRGERVRSRWVS